MPDGTDAVNVAQKPADAERVAKCSAPQFDRLLLHLAQHRGGQELITCFGAAVAR